MMIIDIEASGLHPDLSYPIEIGVCRLEDPEQSLSFLIKPDASWQYWDDIAEEIHGIRRDELEEKGVDLQSACRQLNEFIKTQVISDAPDFDFMWLRRLFMTAGLPMRFKVTGFHQFLSNEDQERVHHLIDIQGRPHRALADARMIAQTLKKFV
ncbi:3'-5' exonuclease [Nitrincola tapanii]|nr:exonuclease domain-containing protein [Nitrincola tapanii]